MPISRGFSAASIFVALAISAGYTQTRPTRLYLEALDQGGPVSGLKASDVAVFDAGSQREVSRLAPADDPMRILLLVDNSGSAKDFIQEVRSSVVAFAGAIPAGHELGLVTIGGTPVVRQEPSHDRTKLEQIARTLTTSGAPVLVNAIHEMYERFLRTTPERWPILVIVTTDGPEASGQFYPEKFAALGRDMQANDVVAHAIVLTSVSGPALQVQIAQALTGGTGGRYDTTSTAGALTVKLASFAQDIVADYERVSTQYVLEYPTATGQPSADLKVSVLRDGITMRMSRAGRIRD